MHKIIVQPRYPHSVEEGCLCENAGSLVNSVCLLFAFSLSGERQLEKHGPFWADSFVAVILLSSYLYFITAPEPKGEINWIWVE